MIKNKLDYVIYMFIYANNMFPVTDFLSLFN